jgi:RHS repeat-associated protein
MRVLGTNTFLASTIYYDEKGRQIQSIEDNIKSGKDVTTLQYQWDGRLLSSDSKHTTAGSGYSSFGILTKNIFDKIGRVTSIQKKYGSNAFKTVAIYDLDDMGRLKTKHLDPGYTGSGKTETESLTYTYTYNIHDNITGINKNYALKASGYDKWSNFFGMYLGFDNRDAVFNVGKLDGHVTGIAWNTQGDDAQRKYDYSYDNAGRMIKADFREKKTTSDAWSNAKMHFSVGGNGTGSSIQYDLNGNLLSMLQKGILPGGTAPVTVDNLTYTYTLTSNKLAKVTDNGTAGSANGMMGDFKDGINGGDDYAYDNNGNLIIDLNKNATGVTGGVSTPIGTSGITYNFLDKPELIQIPGKGTIQIIYDADGNKLQRKFTPETGTAKTTTYINEFVYQDDSLSFINFEEGRIRVLTPVSTNNGYDGLAIDGNMDLPNSKRGAYDYFIRDYQQNVRMVLTEETHYGINDCTMESARASNEEPYFGQAGANNEVVQTRTAISTIPGQTTGGGWHSNISSSVSKLGALTHKVGPNVLLKVMAGDQINATASYYYQNPVTNGTGNYLTTSIVTALAQTILGSPATTSLDKGNTTPISTELNADGYFLNKTAPDANNSGGSNPKAYLTVVFFNERFEYVSEGSTYLRVAAAGDGQAPLVIPNVKAPKNGYAYVYLSNESNEPVYFDDFKVADTRGRIIEENHYYAFGLRIDGISSKKLDVGIEGSLKNNNLYNDKELFDDADLDWYDYGFRNYDPQIGRFPQLDPLTDNYPELTNYQYASNDPILNIVIDVLEGGSALDALSAIPTGAMAAEKSLAPVVVMGLSQAAKSSGSFFSAVGNFLSKAGSSLVNGAKGFINEMSRRAKVNINKDISWVKGTVNQLGANAKANWASGNTLIQQLPKDFMENPLEFLEGGAELDMLKGVGIESEELSNLIKAENTGWRVGDPITNLTTKGNTPAWSTVRQRFWKNEAFFNSSAYTKENILRMRKGLAPQIRNPTTGLMESMELHHTPPQRDGGLFKFKIVTPEQHSLIDPFRRIKK